jgi:hypothetical protein
MQRNFLVKRLVLPLSILTILFFILAYVIPWQGLFINLSTTLLGILITVFYVDIVLSEHDKRRMRNEVIRVASDVIIPALSSKIFKLNQSEWKNLVVALSRLYKNWDILIERFETKMEPMVLSSILEIQDKISSVDATCQLTHELLGVPDNQLRPLTNSMSAVPLKRYTTNSIKDDIEQILRAATYLLQNI